MAGALIWNPVYKVLEERIGNGDNLALIIVPFAKLDALKRFHGVQMGQQKLKVVCRWALEDLTSGASDVEVFAYLKDKECELYVNQTIHLKLYVFASNCAFSTSGNLTLRGLGYSSDANVEVGNFVSLGQDDWTRIYQVVATSRQVDDEMYVRFRNYVDSQPSLLSRSPTPDLLGNPKAFTILSLPATETPSMLMDYYLHPTSPSYTPEEIRRRIHDLVIFGVRPGLAAEEFTERLGEAFRKAPFVIEFVDFIKRMKKARFGTVNDWIRCKCEDVPLPYRWEIKENTRILYDWLAHFFPEITWEVPGRHSQVIYWKK
jgi:hypothetical protein